MENFETLESKLENLENRRITKRTDQDEEKLRKSIMKASQDKNREKHVILAETGEDEQHVICMDVRHWQRVAVTWRAQSSCTRIERFV